MKSTVKKNPVARIAALAATLAFMASLFVASPIVHEAAAQPAPAPAPAPAPGPTPPPAAPRRTALQNPLGTSNINVLVGRAINGFLGLSGSFALLMFVYGAFTWITSGGSPDKIARGKKIFTYATIGLVVIFGSYAFLSTFINALGAAGST
ncbi:MAG TPA: hypothetical protein VL426_04325 [Candidatus Binatia bacterium]|jgi:hypothetical protein|nr:hypothetical protein [Candidatus Binatia bacterium]